MRDRAAEGFLSGLVLLIFVGILQWSEETCVSTLWDGAHTHRSFGEEREGFSLASLTFVRKLERIDRTFLKIGSTGLYVFFRILVFFQMTKRWSRKTNDQKTMVKLES